MLFTQAHRAKLTALQHHLLSVYAQVAWKRETYLGDSAVSGYRRAEPAAAESHPLSASHLRAWRSAGDEISSPALLLCRQQMCSPTGS